MGERSPINDTDARGMFIGMRPDTTRADMVQAVLEGVAFAVRDSFEIAKKLGINIKKSTICGGGAKSKLWRQILCNVLGVSLEIPIFEEGPGMGAAMLAMVACGVYKSPADCADWLIKKQEIIEINPATAEKYEEKYRKFSKIYPQVKELYKELI